MNIPLHVKVQDLLQGVENTVVEERAAHRDVSHGRCAEEAAVLTAGGEIASRRATQSKIKVGWVGVCRNARVAWNPHIQEVIIREHRRPPCPAENHMATRAVALRRILEQRDTALLLLAQLDLAAQEGVVLAVE